MYPLAHAIISLVVAVGAVAVGEATVNPALAVGYGVALGVLIDLDHFLLSWAVGDSLAPLKRVARRPWIAATDPGAIFEDSDLGPYHRLVSHVVIAGAISPAVWLVVDPFLGTLSAVVLYAHLLADLVADLRTFETVRR
ncbi:hypothetical protein Hrd1104_08295 [Halorhabdus sp. CBA1104]|uniref:hypothetical protein n=1 Tax=unclassified Halorhabdus TaxID=2621901 RepID=UPI0012B21325|nr:MULTISPECIES: hypothetical protein [unclassified Halorhabdus]QGN07303.1 hypothetical protein Hrd1104_08295 [Halorhabdus sp. CBA1104]